MTNRHRLTPDEARRGGEAAAARRADATARAAWQARLAAEPITVDDFIADGALPTCCGFVLDLGPLRFGAHQVPAYRIVRADGNRDIILHADARLIAPSDAHFLAMAGIEGQP